MNLVPDWLKESMGEDARIRLPDDLSRLDMTRWPGIIDLAHTVIAAARADDMVVDIPQSHAIYQVARNLIHFGEELPEGFTPYVHTLLETYGTKNATEGEKFVQYSAEEAMTSASADHLVHLLLFFGAPAVEQP